MRINRFLITMAAAGLVPAAAFSSRVPAARAAEGRDYEAEARALYQFEPGYERQWPVEFHIRVLEPLTQELARTSYDLGEGTGSNHFADEVTWTWGTPAAEQPRALGAVQQEWTPGAAEKMSAAEAADAWKRYFSQFRFIEFAQLKIKQAHVPGKGEFDAKASFHAAGQERSGSWRHDHGKVHLHFAKTDDGWRIDGLELVSLLTERRETRLFREVGDEWLRPTGAAVRKRLRRDSASDDIHRALLDESLPPGSRLQPVAMDAHPGAVVVDVDGDGWDDLYVWDVLGPATLLHNVEGTHFEDETERFGLDFRDISAAAFGDLDNDGVMDLVLGRWFTDSQILYGHEQGGKRVFLPTGTGPAEVGTITLVDVNRDGRLDIFFGTTAHDHHGRAVRTGEAGERADANVNQIGPPNVLLVNHGDGNWVDETSQRGLWLRRNTLQAAFADVNDDGWPDVFFGNDFAPGNFMVNERGVFRDVSRTTGADDIFFGMGADWGDFDGDGDLDLYASAMSSSAGRRIMSDESHFDTHLDPSDIRARLNAARGNTLLRNDGAGRFSDATATDAYAPARNGNWAYGAQYFDADNDGYLDVMSPNGFFTASGLRPEQTFRDL